MKLKFWGTRGSIPVPGKNTIKYGGNTSCIQITNGDDFLILDAGTGIRELGNDLLQNSMCEELHLLITHTHWDHIQGLPFFQPIYSEKCRLNIYSESKLGASISKVFETQWDPNYFPVTADIFKDKVNYNRISADNKSVINGFEVETINSSHSEGTLSYKIKVNGKTIVYMTDNELFYDAENQFPTKEKIAELNSHLIEFTKDADVLIHDSMYQFEDYAEKIGWGHSNNHSAAIFATLANVKKLFLFHYDPDYNDHKIEDIGKETNEFLSELNSSVKCYCSSDGLEVEL